MPAYNRTKVDRVWLSLHGWCSAKGCGATQSMCSNFAIAIQNLPHGARKRKIPVVCIITSIIGTELSFYVHVYLHCDRWID